MVKEAKEPLDVENLKIGDTFKSLALQECVLMIPRKRTVGELKEWLKQFNDDERVWAKEPLDYEGEVCGICTEDDIFETRS